MMKRIGRVRGALERSGPWRLLVVDDDEELVRIVRRAASVFATDLAVDVALTAEEARALLARERYDVVLLDQVLDGTNRGVDLLGAMPRRQPGAVVAMMSSMGRPGLVELTRRHGTMPLLPKPITATALRHVLHEALDPTGRYPGHVAPLR